MSLLVLWVVVAGLAAACAAALWRLRQRHARGQAARDQARRLHDVSAQAIASLHHAGATPVLDPLARPSPAVDAPASEAREPAPEGADALRRADGRRRTRTPRPSPAPPAPLLRRDP